MFKRLREKITEEASKSVAQFGNNANKSDTDLASKGAATSLTEDLITLSESSAVVVPHTISQQFSIGDDDEGSISEQSTPQKNVDVSNGSATYSSMSTNPGMAGGDAGFSQEYRPKRLSYIPQSDIESEREDPPTLNLEGISKEQLLSVIDLLKARSYKYKNKYSEVVKNFKELRDEKIKIEKTLIETQDKGSRRNAELREQCQLEQKAKAHLEANLRLMLEEKDSRISVLETQINLLKDANKEENTTTLVSFEKSSQESSNGDLLTGDTESLSSSDSAFQEKIERLEHQMSQAKKTITAQTEQISLLKKQNENISKELEEKVKRVNDLEDQQISLKSDHESLVKSMQIRLDELEKQQEESAMAMAETKKNMHEELELKEKQLVKAEKEATKYQHAVELEEQRAVELQKRYEGKINELHRQLESTEKTLEDEKQNLMQELARGKTAALTLMQKDCAQKISAVEEEWKAKLQELQFQESQAGNKNIIELNEKLKEYEAQAKEFNTLVLQLEKENESLKDINENLKSVNAKSYHEENVKCLKEKYETVEKNYSTQLEELKEKFSKLEKQNQLLEEENLTLSKEKEELSKKELKFKSEIDNVRSEYLGKIQKMQEEIKDQDNKIVKLETELKSLATETTDKIEAYKKKIKSLEQEREQLMHEAQERVSATEAKCRADLKSLQDEKNKLKFENKDVDQLKSQVVTLEQQLEDKIKTLESSKVESKEKFLKLKEQLSEYEEKLLKAEEEKQASVNKLIDQLKKLEAENSRLYNSAKNFENIKSEKEALNEKLKQTELQMSSYKKLESERNSLKLENTSLLEQLQSLNASKNDNHSILSQNKTLEEASENLKIANQHLTNENEKLKLEIKAVKDSLDNEVSALKTRNDYLSKQIDLLEKLDTSNKNSSSVKSYIASVRAECEKAIKDKEDDMATKLKLLVRDFAEQMDLKDRDCDKITSEILEKNQDLEERLTREHRTEIGDLRQHLFEKECALDDMRDDYEEKLQEKNEKIKEYETTIRNLSHSGSGLSQDSALLTTEGSDWDDTWAVPEETLDNTTSPNHVNEKCDQHLLEIETLKEELTKCNSEIKELKVLLRLSPPESMVNNNSRRESLQSIPEPTEFEYLKNIIYEYMMGKEPITLVKVIAAVLKFSETQTQQVIRKEELRHHTK